MAQEGVPAQVEAVSDVGHGDNMKLACALSRIAQKGVAEGDDLWTLLDYIMEDDDDDEEEEAFSWVCMNWRSMLQSILVEHLTGNLKLVV
jgi:hypothetical protein